MAPITLLIVDDEVDLLEIYALMFASEEFHVMRAKNVKEALLLMESVRPDVLITDIVMPNGSGDILSAVTEDRGIPTIICSGIVDGSGLKLSEHCVFMSKPVDASSLISLVRSLAVRARALAA